MNILAKSIICAACAVSFAAPATATVINFEEFAPQNTNGTIPAGQYGYLGVTFQGTDDSSTIGGISNGDPGNWDLEGTNGSAFSGFNGDSYALTLLFGSTITSFSLDASRSNGSVDGTITIEALLNGFSVGTDSEVFGAVNTWSTLALIGVFDEIRITGTGTNFHPFGIDNLVFDGRAAVPESGTWAMMLLGFGGLGFALRRRKEAAAALESRV